MKVVSQDYKDSMAQTIRNRSYCKIALFVGNTAAATDGKWVLTKGTAEPWSSFDSLPYGIDGSTVHTCEWNRCLFNDPCYFIGKNNVPESPNGFVSTVFSETQLEKTFSTPQSFPGITIAFDSCCNEHVTGIYFEYYAADGSLLVSSDKQEVTSATQFFPVVGTNVSKVVIRPTWLFKDRRVRIERVVFGVEKVLSNKDIEAIKIKRDVDPIARRAPNTEVIFSILDYTHQYDFDNPSGIWGSIDEHAPISVTFGYEVQKDNIEWLAPDKFVLIGKPSFRDNVATFRATSSLESLTQNYPGSTYTEWKGTVETLATDVVNDGHLLYNFDSSLSKLPMTVTHLKEDKHINCLQQLAQINNLLLYVDSTDTVVLKPFVIPDSSQSVLTLTDADIIRNSRSAEKIPKLSTVVVHIYKREYAATPEGETETPVRIYVEKISFAPQETQRTITIVHQPMMQVHCHYSGTHTEDEISTTMTRITFGPPASDIDNVLYLFGLRLVIEEELYTLDVSDTGDVAHITNPVLATRYNAVEVAQNTAEYLKLRNTYTFDYRGNPELEVGDVITFQTPYSSNVTGLVLVHELLFDGSLHGKLKVKVLDAPSSQPVAETMSIREGAVGYDTTDTTA